MLRRKNKNKDFDGMARTILLTYLQHWDQSMEDRKQVLNDAVKFVGIKAVFIQENGKSGWTGKKDKELKRASQFRKDIDACWPIGSWEEEHAAVRDVLIKYAEGK